MWKLLGADGKPYSSSVRGTFGGHRGTKIFGRLDCPAALRALARKSAGTGYLKQRVFFRDAATARAAGFRPCAVCMPREYAAWKAAAKLKPRRAG